MDEKVEGRWTKVCCKHNFMCTGKPKHLCDSLHCQVCVTAAPPGSACRWVYGLTGQSTRDLWTGRNIGRKYPDWSTKRKKSKNRERMSSDTVRRINIRITGVPKKEGRGRTRQKWCLKKHQPKNFFKWMKNIKPQIQGTFQIWNRIENVT